MAGCGQIAAKHAQALQNLEGARLVAVADIREEAARGFGEKWGVSWHTDYADLLANPDVDAIILATPSGMHVTMAVQACRAGKHLVVEKPLAMSSGECDAIVAAAEAARVKVGVVHPHRFLPVAQHLREALAEGRFGRLSHGAVTVRWNRNADYYRQAPWRGTKAQDGGVLMNQAIHSLDLLLWLMGEVEEVSAVIATRLHQIEAEDVALVTLKFAGGVLGAVEATTNVYPRNLEEKVAIFGETGTAVLGGGSIANLQTWQVAGDDEGAVLTHFNGQRPDPNWIGHQRVLADMAEAIRNDRPPMVDAAEGRRAVAVIEKAVKSAQRR